MAFPNQTCPCDACKRHFAASARRATAPDFAPPDPYATDLAAMRAASATPESRADDDYKASRTREFAAALSITPRAARITAAELAVYAPPDSYAAGIRALQEAR